SKDDAKWDHHKSSTDVISYYYASSAKHSKYSVRMDSCAELLRFQFIDNLATGETELKLNKAQFCRVRLCPVCQWRRSMAWRARLFQNLPLLFAEKPNLSFIFLTLTVKNCPITSLSDTLKWMNQAWNRLIGRKEVKKAVKGFIRATEVTKSGEQAHPHFHVILAVNKSYFTDRTYIKTAQWAELWQDCLQVDYLPLVDARKIRQKGDQIELKAVLETLKYTTKIEHLIEDKDWFLELSDQLFKKRFIATGGCFKDVLKEEVSNEEMIKGEQSEEFDLEEEQEKLKKSLFFGFDHQVKKYKKVKNPHS
ncbi:protein rep, partial [Avibacterium paragallinarum]